MDASSRVSLLYRVYASRDFLLTISVMWLKAKHRQSDRAKVPERACIKSAVKISSTQRAGRAIRTMTRSTRHNKANY